MRNLNLTTLALAGFIAGTSLAAFAGSTDRWGSDNTGSIILQSQQDFVHPAPAMADRTKACGSFLTNDNSEMYGSVLLDVAGDQGVIAGGRVHRVSAC